MKLQDLLVLVLAAAIITFLFAHPSGKQSPVEQPPAPPPSVKQSPIEQPPAPHTVSIPAMPYGPTSGPVNSIYFYETGGTRCNNNWYFVEYQFDWGDGTLSPWSPLPLAWHTWSKPGEYHVKARARCMYAPQIVSDWSKPLVVVITETGAKKWPEERQVYKIFLSVDELFKMYELDPVDTLEKYRGAHVYISGYVYEVRAYLDEPKIVLVTTKNEAFPRVYCTFSPDLRERIALVKEGHFLMVRGKISSWRHHLSVDLKSCSFVG